MEGRAWVRTAKVHLTQKSMRLLDLVEGGADFDEALNIVDREFTDDGMNLRPEAPTAANNNVVAIG